ncbi:MAG: GNAT family N-acetyltransferase [Bacteriovoracaceae bacterium]
MPTKIRQATFQDLNFIATSQVAMAFETENLKLDPSIVKKGVMAVLNDASKGVYYVAEINQQVVACLLTIPEWSDWRNGTVLWIHSVFVEEKVRGLGVYKDLYLHLQAIVQNSDQYRGLRLYVDKTNVRAQAVYQKLGMSKEHYELYEWMK